MTEFLQGLAAGGFLTAWACALRVVWQTERTNAKTEREDDPT